MLLVLLLWFSGIERALDKDLSLPWLGFSFFSFVTKIFLPLSPVTLLQLYTFVASYVEIGNFLGRSGKDMYINQ